MLLKVFYRNLFKFLTSISVPDDKAADCLAKMLTIDPTSRTDVATILEHPFLQLYRWTDFEQMPDQATLDAARDNLRLYDTSTMGVREWRGEKLR